MDLNLACVAQIWTCFGSLGFRCHSLPALLSTQLAEQTPTRCQARPWLVSVTGWLATAQVRQGSFELLNLASTLFAAQSSSQLGVAAHAQTATSRPPRFRLPVLGPIFRFREEALRAA